MYPRGLSKRMRMRSSPIRDACLGVIALCAFGGACEPGSVGSRPTHGSRIAEPEAGAWTWVCAVSVTGREYPEAKAEGKGTGATRDAARTAAIADGCASVQGGRVCENASLGWALGAAMCHQDEKAKPIRFDCTIEVSRPAGAPKAWNQAEAQAAKRACRRAKREACRKEVVAKHMRMMVA